MITEKKAANAIGGKTARACESCLKKRASWFCPSDDAFLCHTCDSSVHSANELAGRHRRVRFTTSSFKPSHDGHITEDCTHFYNKSIASPPAWHQGFRKKARTPRHAKRAKSSQEMMPVVPQLSGDEGSVDEENEEQMIFCVPSFEPFEVELDNTITNNELNNHVGLEDDEFNISLIDFEGTLPGFLPSDNDLVEFAVDVESLLKQGTEEDQMYTVLPRTDRAIVFDKPFLMKNMEGFLEEEIKVEEEEDQIQTLGGCLAGKWEVKLEEETESTTDCGHQFDWSMDVANEMLNFEVNYSQSQLAVGIEEEEEEKKVTVMRLDMEEILDGNTNMLQTKKRRKIFLRLNYEEVISAWAGSSPWTTGYRPEFDPDHDGWPDCMGNVGPLEARHQGGEMMGGRGNVDGGDGGREARVSRYREKRRTRLFSKKIRYEVRKLNAEKRPRLKGRFVKRTSLAPVLGGGPTFSQSHLNK